MKQLKEMTPEEIFEINKSIAMFMGWFIEIVPSANDKESSWATSRNKFTHNYVMSISFGKNNELKTEKDAEEYLWYELCNSNYGRYGKYHNDWNELMKVCDRIETLNNGLGGLYGNGTIPLMIEINRINELFYRCNIIFNEHSKFSNATFNRIEACWLTCGDFAKWYNEIITVNNLIS
jgi:hypothetical protein